MVNTLSFPVSIEKLSEFLPHRFPAIWIDQVVRVFDDGGECVTVIKDSSYMTDEKVRRSSLIELIAQSYGFVSACQIIMGLDKINRQPSQTFLVGFKDLKFHSAEKISIGDFIRTEVKKTHQLGPISLIEGKVFSLSGQCLLSGHIKIFAQ